MIDSPMQLPELELGSFVSVDTETNGLYVDDGARLSTVSVAWVDPDILRDPDPEALRAAVKTGDGVHSAAFPFSQGVWIGQDGSAKRDAKLTLFDDPTDNPNLSQIEYEHLVSWLKRYSHIYQNAKFDLHLLRYAPIQWEGVSGADFLDRVYWDTQVCCQVLWPESLTSSLKPTAGRLWGEDERAEAEALKPHLGPKDDPRYDLVPWEVLGPYAAKDANLTIRLFYHQLAVLGMWGNWAERDHAKIDLCRAEIAVMKALYRMERAGVPYDGGVSAEAGAKLAKLVQGIDFKLPFQPTAHAASRWFFGPGTPGNPGLNLRPYSVTETGKPQLTAQVLNRLVAEAKELDPTGKLAEVAGLWRERAKLNHAESSWYTPWSKAVALDGRLRTCFRQTSRGRGDEDGGTASGRFSVERVNLQAIPHDYRLVAQGGWPVPSPRALIGRAARELEGWELWEFDLAQAELRVAAAWAKCELMLDAIRNGRDLHGETAQQLFDRDTSDPEWDFYRQLGKRGNFTLCFGAGGETFGNMVAKETGRILGSYAANKIVRGWNGIYPEFGEANKLWDDYAKVHGYVPLTSRQGFASGRRRVFRSYEPTHKAFNQLVQASLAEFMKAWIVESQRRVDKMGFGFEPGIGWTGLVLTIHDSLVGLFPAGERGELAAKLVRDAAADVWAGFFGTPDPQGRVESVPGFAEAKRWSAA